MSTRSALSLPRKNRHNSMEPIKLYAPDTYREPQLFTHIELLFPFWGIAAKESTPYVRAAALQYQYSKNDFTLVDSIADADFVVVPYPYERLKAVNPERLASIIADAKTAGKPLLIDGSGDIELPITIPHAVILRIGQYRYATQPNEITVPANVEDLLETYVEGTLQLREKQERPSVGFMGWAKVSWKDRVRLWVKELPITLAALLRPERYAEHKGLLFRVKTLKALESCPRINAQFTARATYSGNVRTLQGTVSNNRREYVQNFLDSDYALCMKGDGNYSRRFYGALSLGRIPLFLDTACVLPLEDVINYREFCVYVDWKDVDRIGDLLADFHAKLTPEAFTEMQKKAREAYEKYLRFDAFSVQLARQLRGFIEKAPMVG